MREILAADCPPPTADAEFAWVSADWLAKWSADDSPGAVDNSTLLCLAHGKVDPAKVLLQNNPKTQENKPAVLTPETLPLPQNVVCKPYPPKP